MVTAEEKFGQFTIELPSKDTSFSLPNLPLYGTAHSDSSVYNVRHFCNGDHLQQYITAKFQSANAEEPQPTNEG
jgi:hypothetical protein